MNVRRRRMVIAGMGATALAAAARAFPPPTTMEMSGRYLRVGAFRKIFDPSVGATEDWWINDHCFVYGPDRQWHLFGITHEQPHNGELARGLDDRNFLHLPIEERRRLGEERMRRFQEAIASGQPPPIDAAGEDNFAHATAPSLVAGPWVKQPFALSTDESAGETLLWAPHVVCSGGLFHMLYTAGGTSETGEFRIHLATSPDLETWTRFTGNPLFEDYFHARDTMVLADDGRWIVYYKANSRPDGGNHVVACRTSRDLMTWSQRRTCFTDPQEGTIAGPTESPFVVRRGPWYYLFLSVRDNYLPGGYTFMEVFRSRDPFHWELADRVAEIRSHAGEVIRDIDGQWYISHCGWYQGGVYLAPLEWTDRVDETDTSMPVPAA